MSAWEDICLNNIHRMAILYSVDAVCCTLYGMAFLLGTRNIVKILIQQQEYKSITILLQYICGQTVCILRIVQMLMFQNAWKQAVDTHYCKMSPDEKISQNT